MSRWGYLTYAQNPVFLTLPCPTSLIPYSSFSTASRREHKKVHRCGVLSVRATHAKLGFSIHGRSMSIKLPSIQRFYRISVGALQGGSWTTLSGTKALSSMYFTLLSSTRPHAVDVARSWTNTSERNREGKHESRMEF